MSTTSVTLCDACGEPITGKLQESIGVVAFYGGGIGSRSRTGVGSELHFHVHGEHDCYALFVDVTRSTLGELGTALRRPLDPAQLDAIPTATAAEIAERRRMLSD
jgi:hypothetical protein